MSGVTCDFIQLYSFVSSYDVEMKPAKRDLGLRRLYEEFSEAIFTHPFTTHEPSSLGTSKGFVFAAEGIYNLFEILITSD